MPSLFITQGPSYHIALPDDTQFAINPTRQTAARMAVAGNRIRQESILHSSTAEGTWSGLVSDADHTILRAMHTAGSAVIVHHRNTAYSATMGLESKYAKNRQWSVTLKLAIVREIP